MKARTSAKFTKVLITSALLLFVCFSSAQDPATKRVVKPNTPEAEQRIKEIESELRTLELKATQLKQELSGLRPLPDLSKDANPVTFGDEGGSFDGLSCHIVKRTKFVSYDPETKIITLSLASQEALTADFMWQVAVCVVLTLSRLS